MKQAVIQTGGKQYLVAPDQELNIELVGDQKRLEFDSLLIFDNRDVKVGTPILDGVKVQAVVLEPLVKGEKVKVFKFKAKKRVKKLTGHRQKYTRIRITSIGGEKTKKSEAAVKKKSIPRKRVAKKA